MIGAAAKVRVVLAARIAVTKSNMWMSALCIWYSHGLCELDSDMAVMRQLQWPGPYKYRKNSNKRRTKFQNLNVSRPRMQLSLRNILKVLSGEWRCSWSSADRRCSNYIWVINKLIAY